MSDERELHTLTTHYISYTTNMHMHMHVQH